jgi:hypothetical protein
VVPFTLEAEAAEGKVVEAGAPTVTVSPIASEPFALVVKSTVQVALPAPTDEDGLKDTLDTTEPKRSPLAGFEALVSALVETPNEMFAYVPAAGLITPVITTEIALEIATATGVAIVTVPAAVVGIAVTVVPFTV